MKPLFLILIFLIGGNAFSASDQGPLIETTCPGPSGKITFSIQSQFQLLDSLLPLKKKFLEESVHQHLQYLKTHLKYQLRETNVEMAYSDEQPQILEMVAERGRFGFGFSFDPVSHKDVKITQNYILSALNKKNTTENESAQLIKYRAEVSGFFCFSKEEQRKLLETIKIFGPADPWLAHWLLPKNHFKTVRWKMSEFNIPPIFDSEYADLPHPEYAWYFWNPTVRGVDKAGAQYQGMNEVQVGREIVSAQVKIQRMIPISSIYESRRPLLSSKKKSLMATVIFGITDPKLEQFELASVFKNSAQGGIETWSSIAIQLASWNRKPNIDLGSLYATGFLTHLDHFLDMKTLKYDFKKNDRLLVLSGNLLRSRKALRINFYFGSTDLLSGEPPQHWRIARKGLLNDDIIFYIGHSGLGENFRWQNILRFSNHPRVEPTNTKDRIIGIFSCYSATYFEKDLLPFLNERSSLILTGSSYTSARGPVGVLGWIDRSSQDPSEQISFLEPGDFLIFRSLGKSL